MKSTSIHCVIHHGPASACAHTHYRELIERALDLTAKARCIGAQHRFRGECLREAQHNLEGAMRMANYEEEQGRQLRLAIPTRRANAGDARKALEMVKAGAAGGRR